MTGFALAAAVLAEVINVDATRPFVDPTSATAGLNRPVTMLGPAVHRSVAGSYTSEVLHALVIVPPNTNTLFACGPVANTNACGERRGTLMEAVRVHAFFAGS